ncbi:MAG: type II toxin-antitoxin system HicB family antitoxin [Chthoniobacteraceae bacterium]
MTIKAVVHREEDGGYWAEVPALPGCLTQGDTLDELTANLREAIEGWLLVDKAETEPDAEAMILEVAVLRRSAARISPASSSAKAGIWRAFTEVITFSPRRVTASI